MKFGQKIFKVELKLLFVSVLHELKLQIKGCRAYLQYRKHKAEDEELQKTAKVKNKLENYAYEMKSTLRDTKISNYCKFDSELLTSFTSSLYFAGLFASLLASSMTKDFGRKLSILVGGLAVLAGSAISGGALNLYMLILGRVVLGIGVGFANQVIPIYLVEIAPSKYRGAFNNGFHFSLSVGILLATLVNYGTEKIKGGWGWRVSIAATALPAIVITLGSFFSLKHLTA